MLPFAYLGDRADVAVVDLLVSPAAADDHAGLDVVAHVHGVVVVGAEVGAPFVGGGGAWRHGACLRHYHRRHRARSDGGHRLQRTGYRLERDEQ